MTQTDNTEIAVLPFNAKRIADKFLVSNQMGCWDFLSPAEFRMLNSFGVLANKRLLDRLYKKGLIVDSRNLPRVVAEYRKLNANLFRDTSLHIAVLTKGCNLHCTYCHAEGGISTESMSIETASRVLQYLFDVREKNVTLEFQGGEALMNWPVLKYLTENAIRINESAKKNLRIALVTNMLLMDDEKMRFLADHNIGVCTSVDGPADIHDQNRKNLAGHGSHAQVMEKIERFSRKFKRKVYMLPTITRHSLAHPQRIIDEYIRLGQSDIALRPVSQIGYAVGSWREIGYTAEEFNDFYSRALEYLLEVNFSGRKMAERMFKVVLSKVLLKQDPCYVNSMNPCGAGRAVLSYAVDGDCYPSDEARMLGDKIFRLGNINKDPYDKILNTDTEIHLLQAGCSDLWFYRSAYRPWFGFDPVVNYAFENNVIPKVKTSQHIKVLEHQFDTVFAYLAKGRKYSDTFHDWLQGDDYDQKEKEPDQVFGLDRTGPAVP